MSLLDDINTAMKDAMKSGDKVTSGTLKMLKTDFTYEKTKTGLDLTDEQILEVIMRAAKKRKEAISEYEKAGRTELADVEKAELEVISKYLPEQMDEAAVAAIVDKIITGFGEVTKKDFGKVMGAAMKELKGKTDGNVVKKVLEGKLK